MARQDGQTKIARAGKAEDNYDQSRKYQCKFPVTIAIEWFNGKKCFEFFIHDFRQR